MCITIVPPSSLRLGKRDVREEFGFLLVKMEGFELLLLELLVLDLKLGLVAGGGAEGGCGSVGSAGGSGAEAWAIWSPDWLPS